MLRSSGIYPVCSCFLTRSSSKPAGSFGDRVGPHAHAIFLESVAVQLRQQAYVLVPLAQADLSRMAELAVKYSDLRLDPTDASVMAIAERLDVHRVATLDRRDFSVVRPRHVEAFTIVP